MTDNEVTAPSSQTLAIRARIEALLGEYRAPERSKRKMPLSAKARTIRRRVKKLRRITRRASKVA
jgi:hypothetical protein